MSLYPHLGYRKKRLTEQDIIERAEARRNLHLTFTEAYDNHRKDLSFCSAFFLLIFALLGVALFLPALIAWFGRP